MKISENAEKQVSSTERTAWNIAARHLARGQKDPVQMIVEAISEERARHTEMRQSGASEAPEIPLDLAAPGSERW